MHLLMEGVDVGRRNPSSLCGFCYSKLNLYGFSNLKIFVQGSPKFKVNIFLSNLHAEQYVISSNWLHASICNWFFLQNCDHKALIFTS